uniref:Uncharacterized protein n=2 Tax=Avena sativa TaxID=4498 RepID=A0ACD5VBX0_AVESA
MSVAWILSNCSRTGRLSHRRHVSLTRSNRSCSATSMGNNRSSQSTEQTKKARTPRRKTEAGNRLEEIDRPLIVPHGILWEKHLYTSREPSTVQGALWSPGAGVRTAASRIVEEFWWRFKCDPLNQEQADAALEENFTNKVRQMLHEEKAAAIKRLNKKGQMPTEVDEEGNRWPTKEALISAKPPGFGTVIGWRLLCEHWSTAVFRKISFTNSKNRLAHGKTVFHCSGARSVVSTRQHLKLKTDKDPGITGAWHHTHNLHRGTDQEKICSQRISKRWEDFDYAMTNTHGENWEEEHPELDAQIIYDAAGRMPHGRLGIANELFTKTEKSKVKSRRVSVSQPTRSAREDRLERDNDRLMRENKRIRGIDLVVQVMFYSLLNFYSMSEWGCVDLFIFIVFG